MTKKISFILFGLLLLFQSIAFSKELPNLILLPIQGNDLSELDKNSYRVALQAALSHVYTVYSGEEVKKKLKKYSAKTCDASECLQEVAIDFQGNLFGVLVVNSKEDGIILSFEIKNVFTDEVVETKYISCAKCSVFSATDEIKQFYVSKKTINKKTINNDSKLIVDNNKVGRNENINIKKDFSNTNSRKPISGNNKYVGNMVAVWGGVYKMGGKSKPIHKVTIKDFYMAETEVTQKLWIEVMGDNPSHFGGCELCPVEKTSWEDAQQFIKKLNLLTGMRYRLPSETEWEYACRSGGRKQKYCGGHSPSQVGLFRDNSNKKTHPVKSKKANNLGLYDMSGNVVEMVQDCWNINYVGAPSNNDAWLQGDCSSNVMRGGSWESYKDQLNSTYRFSHPRSFKYKDAGFRLAHDF